MRVHLVSPVFHGYWRAIAAALEARGHGVTVETYDHNAAGETGLGTISGTSCRVAREWDGTADLRASRPSG